MVEVSNQYYKNKRFDLSKLMNQLNKDFQDDTNFNKVIKDVILGFHRP